MHNALNVYSMVWDTCTYAYVHYTIKCDIKFHDYYDLQANSKDLNANPTNTYTLTCHTEKAKLMSLALAIKSSSIISTAI